MKSKAAYFGVFIALALIFSYVETLIPIQVGIPGVKLGLANLVVVVVLYKMGIKDLTVYAFSTENFGSCAGDFIRFFIW